MAARDFVEACVDVSGPQLAQLEVELEAAGAPSLAAMRRSGYRKMLAVLERGRIRTDSEFYLITGLLSDTADQTLTPVERQLAEQLVAEYETRRAGKSMP